MTINIFVLKGDLNGESRSGAFLFLSGINGPTLNAGLVPLRFTMGPGPVLIRKPIEVCDNLGIGVRTPCPLSGSAHVKLDVITKTVTIYCVLYNRHLQRIVVLITVVTYS